MATDNQFRQKGKFKDSHLVLVLDIPLASIKSNDHRAETQKVIEFRSAPVTLNEGFASYLDS